MLAAALVSKTGMAQSRTKVFELGAGVAVPNGILGRTRGAWPLVRIGVEQTTAKPAIRMRLDGEYFTMAGSAAATPVDLLPRGRLSSFSLVLNALAVSERRTIKPYLLGGLALQGLRDESPDVRPGGLVGLRIGAGIRGRIGSVAVGAEVASQIAVFSIFGRARSSRIGAYSPVAISVKF